MVNNPTSWGTRWVKRRPFSPQSPPILVVPRKQFVSNLLISWQTLPSINDHELEQKRQLQKSIVEISEESFHRQKLSNIKLISCLSNVCYSSVKKTILKGNPEGSILEILVWRLDRLSLLLLVQVPHLDSEHFGKMRRFSPHLLFSKLTFTTLHSTSHYKQSRVFWLISNQVHVNQGALPSEAKNTELSLSLPRNQNRSPLLGSVTLVAALDLQASLPPSQLSWWSALHSSTLIPSIWFTLVSQSYSWIPFIGIWSWNQVQAKERISDGDICWRLTFCTCFRLESVQRCLFSVVWVILEFFKLPFCLINQKTISRFHDNSWPQHYFHFHPVISMTKKHKNVHLKVKSSISLSFFYDQQLQK